MFLYLSKLLPLFIYPLGLSCLLMGVALVLVWRHPRWAAGVMASSLLVLLIGSNNWVAQGLVRSLEWQNIPSNELPNAAAIVVLGGGTKPAISPRPWVDVSEAGDRILYGSLLFQQKKAPWLILSGGRISWGGGIRASESEDMAEIAKAMGVPASAILQDPTSLNTYENAVNVKRILDEKKIQGSVLLVTSALHLPRSLLIFKKQGISAIPAPTDYLVTQSEVEAYQGNWKAILLTILPDTQSLEQTTKALKEYLGILVYRLRGWI